MPQKGVPMFVKMYLTIKQLNSLHELIEGNQLDSQLAEILHVALDAEDVQTFKKRLISIKSAEFKPSPGTYTVEVQIEEVVKAEEFHVYTPIAIIAQVMHVLHWFPEITQPIYGQPTKRNESGNNAQICAGSIVSPWGPSQEHLTEAWGGANRFHVERVDGENVYLTEALHEECPAHVTKQEDKSYHGPDCFQNRRNLALKVLKERGTDYFTRQEFMLHL